jgi:hypothetical protein
MSAAVEEGAATRALEKGIQADLVRLARPP